MNFLQDALGPVRGKSFAKTRLSLAEIVMEGHGEIAQEGFFDNVRNMFRRREVQAEKEYHEEGVDLPAMRKAITVVQTAVRSKREVRVDSAGLALGPYAKWMTKDGAFVSNDMIAASLQEITDMLVDVKKYLLPASIEAMKATREKIFDPIMKGATIESFDDIETFITPQELDRQFTVKQPLYKGVVAMRTERNLGEWFMMKSSAGKRTYITATTSLSNDARPGTGQFDCLLPDEVKNILRTAEDIVEAAGDILDEPIHPEQDRLQKVMDAFDQTFDVKETVTPARQKWGEAVYREGYNALAQHSEASHAAKFALHNVRVVLRLCEMSVRRMK